MYVDKKCIGLNGLVVGLGPLDSWAMVTSQGPLFAFKIFVIYTKNSKSCIIYQELINLDRDDMNALIVKFS